MSKFICYGSLALSAVLVPFAGCCGGTSTVELVPVSGTVTVAGKLIEGVLVTLLGQSSAVSGEKRVIPSGQTDAQGKFTLHVSATEMGAPAGQYTVLFQKLTMPDGSPILEGQMAADVGAVNQILDGYSDPSTSPESVTIPAGGSDSLSFDLKAKR